MPFSMGILHIFYMCLATKSICHMCACVANSSCVEPLGWRINAHTTPRRRVDSSPPMVVDLRRVSGARRQRALILSSSSPNVSAFDIRVRPSGLANACNDTYKSSSTIAYLSRHAVRSSL
ncbi:hypothetical protein CBOM_07796 [Ceraceosorus bombacis]|uniref:Secreted protein n=1 Tax=Ceraceosorus bombacis TaxID=401625 RepID=A0A0N7LAY2_9BASI|nr:hypothetical protein CBOM_07796 [Ceraceosorus bombacis]